MSLQINKHISCVLELLCARAAGKCHGDTEVEAIKYCLVSVLDNCNCQFDTTIII